MNEIHGIRSFFIVADDHEEHRLTEKNSKVQINTEYLKLKIIYRDWRETT